MNVKLTAPTSNQRKLYAYLFAYTMEHGYQPNMREAAAHFGWASASACKCHMEILERCGWLRSGWHESRAVRFLRRPDGGQFLGFVPKEE